MNMPAPPAHPLWPLLQLLPADMREAFFASERRHLQEHGSLPPSAFKHPMDQVLDTIPAPMRDAFLEIQQRHLDVLQEKERRRQTD